MILKSNSSKTLVATPNGARWQLLMYRVLPLLLFLLVASAPLCLKAQSKSRRAATAESQASKTQSQSAQIIFNYYPSPLFPSFKESEYVFVEVARDGSTQAVRYGQNNPAIIAVYEGKLSKADVARLVIRTQLAIPKASEINIPFAGSCDAETFDLSLNSPDGTQSFMKYPGCLPVMPEDIRELVGEMRAVWKRLDESHLAYGYIRSFPLNEDFLKSRQRNTREFVSINNFPRNLRAVVRDARKKTPKFYPVTQAQYNHLLVLTSDPSHFYVIDNGRTYSLSGFFISRKISLSPQSSAKESVASVMALGSPQARGWRGIIPLRSSRQDVEKLIGHPTTAAGSSYQTSRESVYVQYSDGRCEKGWPFGWNVAPDTVVMLTVSPKQEMLLTDLNFNEANYQKWHESHLSNMIHYVSYEEGIDIQADEDRGIVISINYMPTAADSDLKCPEASRRLPLGRSQADSFFKFDAYGDIPFSYERERLDSFAAEMQRQPNADGYIIAYAGVIAHAGEAKARAACAKNYLIEKHKIKSERISVIDGGYRAAREVELYVEPRNGPMPLAVPSVRPSKVKIIGQNKPMRCGNGRTLRKLDRKLVKSPVATD